MDVVASVGCEFSFRPFPLASANAKRHTDEARSGHGAVDRFLGDHGGPRLSPVSVRRLALRTCARCQGVNRVHSRAETRYSKIVSLRNQPLETQCGILAQFLS